jgi:hypothetical protein
MSTDLQLTPTETAEILAQRAAASGGGATPAQPATPPTVTDAAPSGKVSEVLTEAGKVASLLSTGIAGPQAAAVGTLAAEIAKVGGLVWKVVNPHTGATSKHPTLAAAKQAAVANLNAQHPTSVESASPNAAVEITPVISVTAADAAAIGVPSGASST